MPSEPVQTYENHRTFDNALYYIAGLNLAAAAISLVGTVFPFAYLGTVPILLLAAGSIWTLFRMRAYATRLQDRIIREEMRTRLAKVLPPDLAEKIGALTYQHLIGLRFASDAELAELVQRILANPGITTDEIKRQVKNWQADYLRV
jgi:hypothetical protein